MASSSSTRWAQVWRARMVSSPLATSDGAQLGIVAQIARRCARHLGAVRGDQEVLPGRNSPSASSHGAETSGMPQASASNTRIVGMPGSIVDVVAARHVHGRQVAGEDLRRARVRRPAAVAGAVAGEQSPAPRRDSARRRRRAAARRLRPGANRNFSSSARALAVAPVADPDEAVARAFAAGRVEQARVGGLVPDPDAVAPAPAAVDLAPASRRRRARRRSRRGRRRASRSGR